ncbi:hypothetical protein AB0M11_39885 [Streptomyces sp. NPDC051987]|uniref:hypothetical protein n=1 Tax=Streptomyces sp. NPDC051987 TaxID=3155808 RepID=UPI003443ADE0
MRQYGYDYEPPALTAPVDTSTDNNPRGDLPNDDPRAVHTGYRDRAAAQRPVRPPSGPPARGQLLVALAGSTSRARITAPATTIHGRRVPPGGCIGRAQRAIAGHADPSTVFSDAGLTVDIRLDAYFKTASDSRVRAVFSAWSACMTARGFHYATPLDAAKDKRWNADRPPSRLELDTAAADVACKYQHNVGGVFHAVEVAFETAALELHRQPLEKIRSERNAALARADGINATYR